MKQTIKFSWKESFSLEAIEDVDYDLPSVINTMHNEWTNLASKIQKLAQKECMTNEEFGESRFKLSMRKK